MGVLPPPGCEHCPRSRAQALASIERSAKATDFTKSELQSTAFADDATTNRIQVVLWALVGISALFLAMRIYCKISYTYAKFRFEDALLIASWLVLATDATLNEFVITSRFGRPGFPLTLDNLSTLAIISLSSITCSFVGQVWSKTSFAISLLRMCEGWKKGFVWFAIVSMNLLFSLSAIFFWIGCAPIEKRWKLFEPGKCWDFSWVVTFGIFVSSYSGVLDIALAAIPWMILMRPNPKEASSAINLSKKEKIGVSVALSMGVLAGMAAFVKASYMQSITDTAGDFSNGGAELAVWAAAETAITIVASTVPVLRVLLRDTAAKNRHLPEAIKMKVKKTAMRPFRDARKSIATSEDRMRLAKSGVSMSTAGESYSSGSSSADSQSIFITPSIKQF